MHHHLSLRSKLIIMLSVMASLFLVALDQTIIATALGRIVEEFHAFDALSWIVTAYLLTTTVTVPIAGKLSDLFGRRLILLIGVGVFAIASLFAGASGSVLELIIWRGVQGIGGGIITANAFTIIGDLFAARERGRWQGLIGAVFGLSSVVGPLLGGWLTDHQQIFGLTTDWRWTFYINIPIGLLAFIFIWIFCPPLKHDNKPVIDYKGAALLTLILSLLILAVDNTEQIFAGFMDVSGMSLFGLRAIMFSLIVSLLAAFIWVEHRAQQPIIPLKFFKNGNYVRIIVIAMLFGSAFMGSILYLTQFNQQVFGATPTESGMMLLPMVAGIMVSSISAGQIISRTGRYKIFMQIGFTLATVAMVLLTTLTPESSFFFEAIIITILGLGMGVAMPVMNLAIQNEFEQKELGAVTSSNQLFRSLGSTVGTAVFGAVLTAGIISGTAGIQDLPYLKTLSQSEQAREVGDFSDANTLLNLNMPTLKNEITQAAEESFNALPATLAGPAREQFQADQQEFSDKVSQAFSHSLRDIFIIASGLMLVATILAFTLKERVLKSAKAEATPGLAH